MPQLEKKRLEDPFLMAAKTLRTSAVHVHVRSWFCTNLLRPLSHAQCRGRLQPRLCLSSSAVIFFRCTGICIISARALQLQRNAIVVHALIRATLG